MKRHALVLACLGLALPACAADAEQAWQGSVAAEVWAYTTQLQGRGDSPLNPDNRLAKLAGSQATAEARINLRWRDEESDLVLRPRLLRSDAAGEAYLSQGFLRTRLDSSLTLTAGRELLSWGPANFRSPSHPIYFDAGRSNPLREVSGVDLVRINLNSGESGATLARVVSRGHLDAQAAPGAMSLAKFDLRGEAALASLIVAGPVYGAAFVGGYAQATLGEAWLVYGEFGSGRRAQSPRAGTGLVGAAYTLENGQSVALEALHDAHGYGREEIRRYFADASALAAQYRAAPEAGTAAAALRGLGQVLSQAPALLGRDYGHLLWQSNPQEGERYWRLMLTRNFQDRSSQLGLYLESSLSPRLSAFLAATRNLGGAGSEFSALWRTSLVAGVKCFLF